MVAHPLLVVAVSVLGIVAGMAAFLIGEREMRWVVFVATGTILLTILAVVHDKERVLWIALVLALQADVSLRLLHGHVGSGGISLPLLVFPALALLLLSSSQAGLESFDGRKA
jgi:hypothetical protein